MLHRRFGRTELQMPVLSCGGMRYQHSWDASELSGASVENQRNLEATIERALEVGICHIETARGYGTSEDQLGRVLTRLPRERLIVQTKVGPDPDASVFRSDVEDSLRRLGLDTIDLFGFHGLNNAERIDWTLRPGGCYEVALELRAQGKLKHIGFSTHGPTDVITNLVQTGLFDYVNLHWYYIFQDNGPAIEAARAADMGVFIISPSDKGGMLYQPSAKLAELCKPYSPMLFNDLFCLSNAGVSTISIGAARPSDFDEHLKVLDLLQAEGTALAEIQQRLDAEYERVLGAAYASTWQTGLPSWEETPGETNIRSTLWIYNLVRAFDLVAFGQMRYQCLSGDDHWFPGSQVSQLDFDRLASVLRDSPHAASVPELLRQAHAALYVAPDSV